jgi:hypothetical protein
VAAFAVGTDVRQERADAVEHAHQIDVEHPAPVVERNIVDAAAAGDPGIVADDVHVAERRKRRRGRALEACRIGHVAGHAAHIRPEIVQALDRSRQRLGLDIGEHHLHARFREGTAERETDAARAASHERGLAGKLLHEFLHCACQRDARSITAPAAAALHSAPSDRLRG